LAGAGRAGLSHSPVANSATLRGYGGADERRRRLDPETACADARRIAATCLPRWQIAASPTTSRAARMRARFRRGLSRPPPRRHRRGSPGGQRLPWPGRDVRRCVCWLVTTNQSSATASSTGSTQSWQVGGGGDSRVRKPAQQPGAEPQMFAGPGVAAPHLGAAEAPELDSPAVRAGVLHTVEECVDSHPAHPLRDPRSDAIRRPGLIQVAGWATTPIEAVELVGRH